MNMPCPPGRPARCGVRGAGCLGLRAMAQKDPLVEYQREGFDMFNAMMEGIKE
ncbi:hypothetical protein DLE01_22745, partial [Streptomyces sp. FT05W]